MTLDAKYNLFFELYQSIEECVLKSVDTANKSKLNLNRAINNIIGFVYANVMKFSKNNLFIKIFSGKLLQPIVLEKSNLSFAYYR